VVPEPCVGLTVSHPTGLVAIDTVNEPVNSLESYIDWGRHALAGLIGE